MFIGFIFGIISSVYLFQIVNVLNSESIPSNISEVYFSYDKFRKFIETFNDNEKKLKYTNLYKKAVWTKRIGILIIISLFILLPLLSALN